MTNTQHTPGPWRVESQNIPMLKGDELFLSIHSEKTGAIVLWDERLTDANARLIAAAPDLLAALQALDWAVTGFGDFEAQYPEEVAAARAAIAKATGGEP